MKENNMPRTIKPNNKEFLQKYVDHKLNSIRCDKDDLSDYLENYTNHEHEVCLDHIEKWGMDGASFVDKFKPSETELRKTIKNSPILNTLAERYKIAIIKGITKDIHYNVLCYDKEIVLDELEEQEECDAFDSLNEKLSKLKLTPKEIEVLKRNY